MSCNNIDNLITRGNDFYLAVTLKSREMVDGQVVVTAFDFDDCDNYDARIYGILRGNTLGTMVGLKDGTTDTVIIDAKDIPLNVAIAVEVTGKKDGRAFRAAEKGFIGIVEYNGQAHVIFTPVTGGQEASLVMTLQFLPSAAVVGKNAYEIWKEQPGNEDKTLEDFINFLGHGESAYEIAVRYGYTGTEEEYNALYFDAVQAANDAADTATTAAGAASDAAELVGQRIDTIDEQMDHLCYHDVAGETVEPVDFDPEADTVWNIPQQLSDSQKQQVRENIGAAGVNDVVGIPIVNHGTSDTGTSSTPYSIAPNALHVWGEVDALYLSLTTGEVGYVQKYMIQFTSGTTATTLSLPNTLMWLTPSTIEANKTYQIRIANGCVAMVNASAGGGEANVIESISVNNTAQTITNKNVNLQVPTSTAVTQIVSISQSAYDALTTKYNSTLYLITS